MIVPGMITAWYKNTDYIAIFYLHTMAQNVLKYSYDDYDNEYNFEIDCWNMTPLSNEYILVE